MSTARMPGTRGSSHGSEREEPERGGDGGAGANPSRLAEDDGDGTG
jgi:hypothetical protein